MYRDSFKYLSSSKIGSTQRESENTIQLAGARKGKIKECNEGMSLNETDRIDKTNKIYLLEKHVFSASMSLHVLCINRHTSAAQKGPKLIKIASIKNKCFNIFRCLFWIFEKSKSSLMIIVVNITDNAHVIPCIQTALS